MVLQLLQLRHDLKPVQLPRELVFLLAAALAAHEQHCLNALQHSVDLLGVAGAAQDIADGLEQTNLGEELGQLSGVTLVGGVGEDVADLGAHVG